MSPTAHSLSLPDRYKLAGHIANGGMAAVWAAEDLTLGRMVAIKVLAEHLAQDPRVVARFEREARAAAQLNHPNVVTVYDVAEHDGRPFIVMERLTGGTLADVLRRGAPSQEDALRWLGEAASALDAAHARGIVHRDIKPGNLLLDSRGRLAVADFGIARVAHDQTVTSTGQVLGTAAYIAPEQALGEPATDASDRYALAVVAYELLTGHRPFEAEHFAAQARAHIEDDPTPPSAQAPELGAAVDAVLLRGMAKDPAERWPSAADFVEALETALRDEQAGGPMASGEAMGGLAPHSAATRQMPPTRRFARRPNDLRWETPIPAPAPAPTPASAPDRKPPPGTTPRRGGPGRRLAPLAILLATLLLAGVVIAAVTGGDDAGDNPSTTPRAASKTKKKETPRTDTQPQQAQQTQEQPAPAAVPSGQKDLGKASQLNAQGHSLQGSNPAGAVPILQQAVAACGGAAFPTDPCAYALYNLGVALVDAGRPGDAIPVLEKRLENPNQQGAVQAELDKARALASGGDTGGNGKAKGKKKD